MNGRKIFVTGTDTEVGKTLISVLLLKLFKKMGYSTLGLKPIASGCQQIAGVLRNDDALQLQQASTVLVDYETVNPFAFEQPIAPHIAAQNNGITLSVKNITDKLSSGLTTPADVTIIEGAGGWFVPLNDQELMSDLVLSLNIPVVLTVGIKLGCINHTLLTVEAIKNSGATLLGWFANCLHPDTLVIENNIKTLNNRISAACLGVIPYLG